MAHAAFAGADITNFVIHDRPMQELFGDAALGALKNPDLKPRDIDALYLGNAMEGKPKTGKDTPKITLGSASL